MFYVGQFLLCWCQYVDVCNIVLGVMYCCFEVEFFGFVECCFYDVWCCIEKLDVDCVVGCYLVYLGLCFCCVEFEEFDDWEYGVGVDLWCCDFVLF